MKATVTKLAPLAAALLCLPIVACTSVDQPEPVPRRVRMDDIEGAQDRVLREMSALILHHKYLEAYNYGIPVDLSAGERAAAEAKRAEIIRDRLIDAWADYRIDRLRKGVETLLGQGKFEAARELVWRVQATPCAEVNAKVDTARTALLNERVNIVEWATLEKIVRDRVAELRRLGDLSGARAYLQGIRPVRAYTVLFDEQLEAVGRTLDALKIPADAYAPVFAATRAAIAEAFADRTETLKAAKAEAPKPPTPPNADAYIQAVKDLREVLVKYGCAEAQADAIIGDAYNLCIVYTIRRDDGTALLPEGVKAEDLFLYDSKFSYSNQLYRRWSPRFVDDTPGDNEIRMIYTLNSEQPLNHVTATVDIRNFNQIDWSEPYADMDTVKPTPVVKGHWKLRFDIDYDDSSVHLGNEETFSQDDLNFTIHDIWVSPIAVRVEYEVDSEIKGSGVPSGKLTQEYQQEQDRYFNNVEILLTKTDGTVLNMSFGGSIEGKDGKTYCSKSSIFEEIIPLEELESISVGGVVYPIPNN